MSKRFGRNQKRKARQAIDQANAWIANKDETIKLLLRTNDIQSKAIDDTVRVLGRRFFTLPPDEMDLDYRLDRVRLPVMRELGPYMTARNSDNIAKLSMALHEVEIMRPETVRDELRRAVHFNVRYAGGRWGYAISDQAIRECPEDMLTQMISQELANYIARDLKNPGHMIEAGKQ